MFVCLFVYGIIVDSYLAFWSSQIIEIAEKGKRSHTEWVRTGEAFYNVLRSE